MPDNRKHSRIKARESAVVVELRYASPESVEENKTIFCSTEDISTHGLRLDLERFISVDTPLQITVIFKEPVRHFRHLGIVRWILPHLEPDRFSLGIEFLNRGSTDSMAWREFLQRQFPQSPTGFFVPSSTLISRNRPTQDRFLRPKRDRLE